MDVCVRERRYGCVCERETEVAREEKRKEKVAKQGRRTLVEEGSSFTLCPWAATGTEMTGRVCVQEQRCLGPVVVRLLP